MCIFVFVHDANSPRSGGLELQQLDMRMSAEEIKPDEQRHPIGDRQTKAGIWAPVRRKDHTRGYDLSRLGSS